jgi:hypothetical protein
VRGLLDDDVRDVRRAGPHGPAFFAYALGVSAALAMPVSTLGGLAFTAVALRAQQITVLRDLRIDGADQALVVTLTADGPISGRLQQITTGQPRLFVDLSGVRPQVDPVTVVNQGPVLRVRVGLHSAEPPATRVVLDVSSGATARLEHGDTDRQLRIVVSDRSSAGDRKRAEKVVPDTRLGAAKVDQQWCSELADRLTAMLEKQTAPSTSQPAMLAALTEWQDLERTVAAKQVAASLQSVHFALLQAIRLARIAATYRNTREFDQANAARAGARLLVNTARARLAEMP